MRIVYFAAGAGQMYCGACMRDIAMARGLIARGHEVRITPRYTPLRIDADLALPLDEMYFGGISAFLQQRFSIFRRMPAGIARLLDSPHLLNFVSRFAISTRPSDLGLMTVSMLAGRDGHQAAELERLIDHLKTRRAPDLFFVTNSMLSGIAPALKSAFDVPVICGLQGEDSFIAAMGEPHATQARDLIRENAASIDGFISPGASYASLMADYMAIPAERIRVVRTPIDTTIYAPVRDARIARQQDARASIGYLSVITQPKGLDLLVQAAEQLIRRRDGQIHLGIAGRVLDRRYWKRVHARLRTDIPDQFHYFGEVDSPGKLDFLSQCDVFCVPSRVPEERGLAAMEAIASGIPVIVPRNGVFPELIDLTGGGILVPPGDPAAIATGCEQLLDMSDRGRTIANEAARALERHYGVAPVLDTLIAVLDDFRRIA